MDHTEWLRLLALNDVRLSADLVGVSGWASEELDPKTLALVRLAALIAVGGELPSYGTHADAAVNAGASAPEIVAVMVSLVPMVGLPCVVAVAPNLAMALGYDADEVFER